MANRIQWFSRGILVVFSVAAILCTSFCLNVICKTSYQKSGLITIRFKNIGARGIPLSILAEPHAVPGVVSIAVGGAHSVASAAATRATDVANDAIESIETAIGSILPKNCSLGVKSFCIGFTNRVECRALPLKLSNVIPSPITAIDKLSNIEDLDRALAQVTSRSIQACLIIGAVFAALAMLLTIYSLCAPALHRLEFISFPLILRASTRLRLICSVVCFIPIIVLTAILYGLRLKAKLPMEFALETGEASKQILAALICALFMGISIILGWALDRYIGDLS